MIERKLLLVPASLLLAPLSLEALECEVASFAETAASSPHGVTLTSAGPAGDAGAYCQIEGVIANADDGQSRIRFRYRLPATDTWNGKFMVTGNGGTAGSFQGEPRARTALELGYAVAQTDTGHRSGDSNNWLMKEIEPGVIVPNNVTIADFAYRSIHLTAVVGKQFVNAFYAQEPEQSYYFGCSTGGRQGLKSMQRYPNDFDGILAGAPVFSLTRLNMSQVWAAQEVARLKTENEALSPAQLDLIKDATVGSCDAIDGLTDRIIDDPRQCDFDPGVLQCGSSESPPQCLTGSQVDFVRSIYRGPVTAAGERIYPGRLPGGEGRGMGGWQGFVTAPCSNDNGTGRCDLASRAWHQDPGTDFVNDFSIDDPEDVAAADSSYYSSEIRADNPDVTPFVQSGGKAILYHGWNDSNVTPLPTVELYEAMEETVSRKRGVNDFRDHIRLFMAPGMWHCGGGDGPNNYTRSAIEAIDAWVTHGEAPDSIVATHDARGISRPWCPYPQVARLRASGLDSNEAESFRCVTPTE